MTEIVAVDIGGTNARFALARVEGGRVVTLAHETVFMCADYASLQTAWEAFAATVGRPLPRAAGIAVACPVAGEVLQMTNNPWIIRPGMIGEKLGLDHFVLINDFGAVGHAVAQLGPEHFRHICGPSGSVPPSGVISIVGPGTGLGVAMLIRGKAGAQVIETEGGHVDFAPLDVIEDAILTRLRARYRRVSIERIVSGPGLANIYGALADIEGRTIATLDDAVLWRRALEGADGLAAAALDRLCMSLGSFAGDIALAQGAQGVVIGGGVGLRIAAHLPRSGFAQRFRAKGRFEQRMANIPVHLITHPQPGLFGAAAAYAANTTG